MQTQLPVWYSAKCVNERCAFAVPETRDANAVRRAGTSHFMDTGHGIHYPAIRHATSGAGGKMGYSTGAI